MSRAGSYLAMGFFVLRLVPLFASARVSLWWNARKGRRAFEDELRRQGMSEEAVEALGGSYSRLKDELAGFLSWRQWG